VRFIEELDRPGLARRVVNGAKAVGKLGCIEAWETTRTHPGVTPPAMQRAVRKWAHAHDVEELFVNVRPGLPMLLGWYALGRGWKLTAIVAETQLERAPEPTQHLLFELWHRADRRHIARDVIERDALITHLVPVIGIADVMLGRVPIIAPDVVQSGPCER
jgi:hypothetical protein